MLMHYILLGFCAVFLGLYLFYALLFPEKF
ncbi:MAG: K(+)-transporting ATPase subunit F [Candidatus Obscuribacterales bacterium]|nr:K(+)-transporting ATPase subunit F [Candidatus Obscuribacterales bacterium]